ncbi:disulfide bond formation protein B [Algihabitans albus]|uniref:disulfide bond formation protein B n=1 Tax=Algihabitans albus TaxID=2164067 RepID=UPI0035CEF21E
MMSSDALSLRAAGSAPWLAAAIAAAALLGALGFQYIGGYPPCLLCHWQRYAHVAALALALLALPLAGKARRFATLAAGLAFLGGAGLAGFHVGVEQGWWEGLPGCSAPNIQGLNVEQLHALLMEAEFVPCDEVAWALFGISMAGWNLVLSALTGAAIVWLVARHQRGSEA